VRIRKSTASVAALTILLTTSSAASVTFVENYGRWRQLDNIQKATYVVALWDMLSGLATDSKTMAAVRDGLKECGNATAIDAGMLVTAVDDYYANNKKHWDQPVFAVFHDAIVHGPCKSYVNERRAKGGLFPWR
jgi:hypothetical protein